MVPASLLFGWRIEDFPADPDDHSADQVPSVPEHPAARPGDVWVMGEHRLICGDATQADVVAKLRGAVTPLLMVTDPPYGISLDTEWPDRAGLNGVAGARQAPQRR